MIQQVCALTPSLWRTKYFRTFADPWGNQQDREIEALSNDTALPFCPAGQDRAVGFLALFAGQRVVGPVDDAMGE